MKELTILNKNGQLLIDSREVAEMIEKRHDNLMRDIKGYSDILTNSKLRALDFFVESSYKDTKGEERPCYLLTRKGCDMVANKMIGEKGVLFTASYVTKFEEMEKKLSEPLKINSSFLFKIAAELEEKEKQIQVMAPKAEYFDALVDRNLLINFRDSAKELKIKEKDFIAWLEKKKFIYRDSSGKIRPFAQHTPTLFEIKEFSNGAYAGVQTLTTPKGRETFRLLLEKDKAV